MNKYKLIVNGFQFDGHAHKLTESEVLKILKLQEGDKVKNLALVHDEIENLLEDYSLSESNWWSMIAPFAYWFTTFTLIDEFEKPIWTVKLKELGDIYDLSDKYQINNEGFDEPKETRDAYPCEGYENILFTFHENKGCLGGFCFESEDEPTKNDFAVVVGTIETPENEIEYLDRFYFRGQELEWDYDYEDVKGKEFTVKVYRLEDVD
jgi:hypothetical protein